MNKQEFLKSIKNRINNFLFLIKKVPETIRYIFTPNKVLLNVWMDLSNGRVLHTNFGDELNFYIVKSLTPKALFNLPCILKRNKENFLVIGSIIESHVNKDSIIWGSGAMYGGDRQLKEKPKKVLAVRGPLTRQYLLSQGINCPEIYGDPALLLPRIYLPQVCKKYKLGVIPHYVDFDSDFLSELKNDSDVKIIKLRGYEDWHKVIDEIFECEFIVSSSLHGLIISDAYQIPNVWIKLSENISGGNFKYHDYFMSVNRDIVLPVVIKHVISKEEILELIPNYKKISWSPEQLLKVCPF